MGKKNKSSRKNQDDNVRMVNKFRGYFMEDMQCIHCRFYQGKRGCKHDKCCCEAEKLDAIINNRIKRKRGAMSWDE